MRPYYARNGEPITHIDGEPIRIARTLAETAANEPGAVPAPPPPPWWRKCLDALVRALSQPITYP